MARPRVYVRRRWAAFPPPTPQPTICKIWQGAIDGDGYGVLTGTSHTGKKRKYTAHRWVWEMVHGPIKPGLVVRHKCDNRPCFRLSHLELGTVAENNQDASERGHLGPVLVLAPSEVALLFDLRDKGLSYAQIHPHFAEKVSLATIKRIGKLGRDAFRDVLPVRESSS